MSKVKSIFVTALVTVMLALIVLGAYLLKAKVYLWIIGAFAVYGLVSGAIKFCGWLQKEHEAEELPPAHLVVRE